MVQMVRESAETGYLANSRDFMNEFEVSRRTVARDLDFLRDEENAPLAYDEARHGYVCIAHPTNRIAWLNVKVNRREKDPGIPPVFLENHSPSEKSF